MSADVSMLARLEPLPPRLRIAHLAALLRCAPDGSPRALEMTRLLSLQSAALAIPDQGGRAG